MKIVRAHEIKVRKEQAEAAAKVLADLELATRIARDAQVKADYLLAGIVAGLVPKGSVVVGADTMTCRLTVQLPEGADEAAA